MKLWMWKYNDQCEEWKLTGGNQWTWRHIKRDYVILKPEQKKSMKKTNWQNLLWDAIKYNRNTGNTYMWDSIKYNGNTGKHF